jgi:hypothetical protein
MDSESSNRKKKASRAASGGSGSNILAHYKEELLSRAPGVLKLIGTATLRNDGTPEAVKSASDFSYSAPSYAGDHFRLAGDSGGIFLDVLWYSQLTINKHSLTHSSPLVSTWRSQGDFRLLSRSPRQFEDSAAKKTHNVGIPQRLPPLTRGLCIWLLELLSSNAICHRFLLVVLGTYKQIRNQAMPVMSDVDEDNFDRAFDLIRPGEN